jgi:AcrR family transcriptional regulator
MSIQDRKSKETEELKQKILNAALRIFAEEGYDKVSMRKIAGRIDYSATTIYRFFRNKEELLGAIAADTFRDLAARFEKVKAEGGEHPLDVLKALIAEYVLFCLERPDMYRLFSDIAVFEMENGVLYEHLGGSRHRVYQSWFGCIRQAIEAGDFFLKDEMRIFLYLWDAVDGFIDNRIRHAGIPRKPPADDAAEYLGLVFRGLESNPSDSGE